VEMGEVRRGFLGVIVDDLTAELTEQYAFSNSRGALITQVIPQSPGEVAGLLPSDVITRIGGKAINGGSDLRLQISQIPPDTSVVLEVIREGETMEVPALLTLRKDTQPAVSLDKPMELFKGVVLMEVTESLRKEYRIGQSISGLMITEVSDHSPHKEDFLPGMVILGINRTKVQTLSEAAPLLAPGKNLLSVYYQGKNNFLVIGVE
ncbi:MAG: PDZ domain-containing protein, partial [Opitutae bacterium]|nr:PDZ domain-containing protein [Opitutae bacterium]